MIEYFPRDLKTFKCDFVKINITVYRMQGIKIDKKIVIFVDYGLDFYDQIKSDRSINKLSLKHLSNFHRLDVIAFSPIEGNIYSFHFVGPDFSMEVEI